MDVHTQEQRSRNMKAIRSSETKMELLLSRALWSRGLRFRRNVNSVIGKPDIAIKKYRIAIFVDSEFFHGKDWEKNKYRIQSKREFWWPKIEGNMKRDKFVNRALKNEGWIVIRIWSHDVKNKLEMKCQRILNSFEKRKNEVQEIF